MDILHVVKHNLEVLPGLLLGQLGQAGDELGLERYLEAAVKIPLGVDHDKIVLPGGQRDLKS